MATRHQSPALKGMKGFLSPWICQLHPGTEEAWVQEGGYKKIVSARQGLQYQGLSGAWDPSFAQVHDAVML